MTTKLKVLSVTQSNPKQHSSELAKSLSLMAKSLAQRPMELRGLNVTILPRYGAYAITSKVK